MMADINFLSLPALVILSLAGGPLLLHRAGYPFGKTVLGSLTGMVVLVALWGVVSSIQHKTGQEALPLGWLVPVLATWVVWRQRDRL